MEHSLVPHSATPLALAMVLGLLSHSVAWAIRVPPILLLVGAGMLMGPDGIGLLAPETLGDGFDGLVGLAAAAVFFAAGIAFEPTRLRTQGTASIHLVPGGFLLTFVGATLFGWGCSSSWDWSLAALFGSLIAATGPTALAPVLKRLRIKRSLSDALEQEAAQSMGMGAIGAMVFLPIAYQPADASSLSSLVAGIAGFGGGSLLGLLGGGLVIRIQRFQNRIPEGLEHALPLALVFLLFQFSNQWMPGSGIAAATVAGVVAGRKNGPGLPSLLPFREPLMVSLSSVMIVVVAAEIRLTEVRELGWPGVFLVMALVLILRPASLFVSTRSSDLRGKEKIMLSGLGPRGLLAAAGAALFASMAEHSGATEGNLFQALVFGILVVTGALASGIGTAFARPLGLQRDGNSGWLILGANSLATEVARTLKTKGEEAVCIALDSEHSQRVDARGVQVLFGNGLAERTLKRAETATRVGALGLTENDALNLLFVREARARNQVGQFAALHHPSSAGITRETLLNSGCQVLFGGPRPLQQWCGQIEAGRTSVQWWTWDPNRKAGKRNSSSEEWKRKETLLPLVHAHGKQVTPVDGASILRPGDEVAFLVQMPWDEGVMTSLQSEGWRPKSPGEVAEARSLEAELSRTEEVPIEGSPPQIETTEIPVPFDSPLHPEVPPLPPETKLEASEEDSPDFPDEATIPNREGSVESPEEDAVDPPLPSEGAGGATPPEPGSSEEEKEPGAEPELSMEDSEPALRDEPPSIPFEAVDSPEKGEPAGEIPEPPIAETIASPKDEESSNEAHEKPVSMPEEKPSLENQEEIPVSLPSPENVPPDAAESSNERESEPDTDAKGDPGEPFSLITPEDIPAASSRKQRARGTSQTKAKGLPTVEIPRTPEHLLADLPLFGTWAEEASDSETPSEPEKGQEEKD